MPRQIFDAPSIRLNCRFSAPSTLEFFHGEHPLRLDGNSLFNELHTVTHAELTLLDFEHDGMAYHVHVWEPCDDGRHIAWQRDEIGARSGPRDTMSSTLLVCTIPAGLPAPDPDGINGPPAPGTGKSLISVKFRKKGSKPF